MFSIKNPEECPFYFEDGLGNENCKAQGFKRIKIKTKKRE